MSTHPELNAAYNKVRKDELRNVQRRLDKARQSAIELEAKRNAIIRDKESTLTPADIIEITELTKGRVSQIRGEVY